jgi:hypothetical protein
VSTHHLAMTAVAATLLVLTACGDTGTSGATRAAEERASHAAAAAAMDATFDKEMGPAQPKPAADKPAGQASKPAPAAKPKPQAEAKPTQGRPSWVDQLPDEAGKLYAVGGAMKGRRDEARRKALQELASSLKVHVAATSTIDEGEITKIGPGGQRVGHAWSTFRNEARLTVDRELTFSRIIAEADDGKDSWALAELDRTAWAAKLRQELGVVDGKLTAERDRLAKAGTGLRQAAQALHMVGPLAARRDALVSDLILADPQATPPACPIDMQALFADCAKGLATISLKLEGAPDAVFGSRVQDAMARQGLTVNEKTATLILRMSVRETPRVLPNGWTRISFAGSIAVVDPVSGNVVGSMQVDENAADPVAAQAKEKVLGKACTAIATTIDERLIDILGQ